MSVPGSPKNVRRAVARTSCCPTTSKSALKPHLWARHTHVSSGSEERRSHVCGCVESARVPGCAESHTDRDTTQNASRKQSRTHSCRGTQTDSRTRNSKSRHTPHITGGCRHDHFLQPHPKHHRQATEQNHKRHHHRAAEPQEDRAHAPELAVVHLGALAGARGLVLVDVEKVAAPAALGARVRELALVQQVQRVEPLALLALRHRNTQVTCADDAHTRTLFLTNMCTRTHITHTAPCGGKWRRTPAAARQSVSVYSAVRFTTTSCALSASIWQCETRKGRERTDLELLAVPGLLHHVGRCDLRWNPQTLCQFSAPRSSRVQTWENVPAFCACSSASSA
eukprot:3409696-Rhodomonas_salina.3